MQFWTGPGAEIDHPGKKEKQCLFVAMGVINCLFVGVTMPTTLGARKFATEFYNFLGSVGEFMDSSDVGGLVPQTHNTLRKLLVESYGLHCTSIETSGNK